VERVLARATPLFPLGAEQARSILRGHFPQLDFGRVANAGERELLRLLAQLLLCQDGGLGGFE
jgi:hypothetical protein